MDERTVFLFLVGAGGALAGEVLKLYELRSKLAMPKYRRVARSWLFWGVAAGMVAASGFIAWAVNAHDLMATPFQIMLSGAGARAIIHSATDAKVNASAHLGADDNITLRDIFA